MGGPLQYLATGGVKNTSLREKQEYHYHVFTAFYRRVVIQRMLFVYETPQNAGERLASPEG